MWSPPGPKKAAAIPKVLNGACSKKRKFITFQNPPARPPTSTPSSSRQLAKGLPPIAPPKSKPDFHTPRKSSSLAVVGWYCCGLGNPKTVQRVKELVKACSPDILFLMETENQDIFVMNEIQDMYFDSHFLFSPHGHGGGGLALSWKNHVDVQVFSTSHNFIDTRISFKGLQFYCTFVYGAPQVANRQGVWDKLASLCASRTGPWYLTGDFNEIINNNEKSGGKDRPESTFCSFQSFLAQCDLFDLQHTGNFLSCRGKRGTHVVHCRLNSAVANSDWYEAFPTARSHYLLFERSYHRPCSLYLTLIN